MKKIVAATLSAMMSAMLLAGCGSQPAPAPSSEPSSEPAVSSNESARMQAIKKAGKLVFVTSPDYPPYEFIDLAKMGQGDEQYVGADVELARYIADKIGVELVIETANFDGVLTHVTENKCDIAIAGIAVKEERKEKMDFTNTYDPLGTQGIMVRKEDAAKYKTLEDFNKADVVLGVQNGSIQQQAATQQMPNAQQSPVGALSQAVLELSTGKIDALVTATTSGEGYISTYPDLVMSDVLLDIDYQGAAIAVPKGNMDFVEELNEIIQECVDTGLRAQWIEEGKALAAEQSK